VRDRFVYNSEAVKMVTKAKQNAKGFKSKLMYISKVHLDYLNEIILACSVVDSLRRGLFRQAPAIFQGTLRKKSGTGVS